MKVTVKRTSQVTEEIEVKEGFYLLDEDGGWPKAMAYNGGEMAMLVVSEPNGISTQISISFLQSLMGSYRIGREMKQNEFIAFMHRATEVFNTFIPESKS